MNYREIRARARRNLGGSYFHTDWMTGLSICLIGGLLCAIPVLGLILMGPINFGIAYAFLKKARSTDPNESLRFGDLFSGFRIFGDTFMLGLMQFLIPFLWAAVPVLIFYVGIIWGAKTFGIAMLAPEALEVVRLLWGVTQLVGTYFSITKAYSFAMAMYIRVDNPGAHWRECLNRSTIMMRGHRVELFWLTLSFLGWYILGALCLGIGVLWVVPYMTASVANFYEARRTYESRRLEEMDQEIQRSTRTRYDEQAEARAAEEGERKPNPVEEYFEARRAEAARDFNDAMSGSVGYRVSGFTKEEEKACDEFRDPMLVRNRVNAVRHEDPAFTEHRDFAGLEDNEPFSGEVNDGKYTETWGKEHAENYRQTLSGSQATNAQRTDKYNPAEDFSSPKRGKRILMTVLAVLAMGALLVALFLMIENGGK
ncbi:MAG: DUF975 family protein [Oscillospiraceae bacterium]|nr:DUF975 family protein [Oscillospiraceae bacterium]